MNKPNIRFNTFSDSWNNPTMEDLFELRNGYTPSKAVDAFWTNGTIPWFRMEDIRSKGNKLAEAFQKITPEAVKSGGLFKQNSIILATTATIGEHAMLIADSLANQQFTNFKIRKSLECNYIPDFINYAFYKVDEWCLKNTNSGGLLSVDLKSLVKQPFYAPSLLEQNKISTFLRNLETTIECEHQKLTSLKQIKSACLQSMFPQEGESVPKVRFKGFNEEWNKKKLKEITYKAGIKNKENLPLESYSISNEFGFIPQNEQFENGGTMTSANKRMYYIVSPNTFAYNPARINVGSLGYYSGQNNVIVSSLYEVFKTIDGVNDTFLLYWFKTAIFQRMITEYQEGGVRLYFFYDKLQKCEIKIPSIEEQQQIAAYFENLDKQITLQTKRLEKLKQIKSACLDKMFV